MQIKIVSNIVPNIVLNIVLKIVLNTMLNVVLNIMFSLAPNLTYILIKEKASFWSIEPDKNVFAK